MSESTVNIADYRPLFRMRTHDPRPELKPRSRFVVLSSNSKPTEYQPRWCEPSSTVVDIRALRDVRRGFPRRAKILRFSKPDSHRLYTMPTQESQSLPDDDPGPLVA